MAKLNFHLPLFQSSVSHDPTEIIMLKLQIDLMCTCSPYI